MAPSLKQGARYTGPKAIFDDESVGFVKAFYALDKTGKELLKQRGKPVRLVHVDLAPGDPEDGTEEFRVAGPSDPPQIQDGNPVELKPENLQGAADVGA